MRWFRIRTNGERKAPPIRKFNPGLLQSDEEVIAQFAVRQHEFEIVSECCGATSLPHRANTP